MARIRSIKPDFFFDEETATLHPDAQLLLIGLSTLADRDGRLENRPVRIKAALFPYRDVDVEARLSDLEGAGAVIRYEANGKRCLALVHWSRDQKPHPKETSFDLPDPPEKSREVSRQDSDTSRRVPVVVGCGSGSGSGCGSSSPAPAAAVSDGVDDLPDATDDAVEEASQPALFAAPAKPKGPPPEALREVWNRVAPPAGCQRWEAMSKPRERAARLALEACPDLARWEAWLTHELARPFNRGENPSGWRADVDWLLRAKTRDMVADFNPSASVVAGKTASGHDVPRLGPNPVTVSRPTPSGDLPRL
jgi:hypothetical protein